jgi:hypothetical protein
MLFVLVREPAPAWYLEESDQARLRGSTIADDGVWGTLACRNLNNWGPIHGGEAIGVAMLEVLNLPSLLVTGTVGLFVDVAGLVPTCRWSWLLAAVFVAVASVQWWWIGSTIDTRGRQLLQSTINRVLLAYAIAPAGALVVAAIFRVVDPIVTGEPIRGTSIMTVAMVVAYVIGLLMLPLWWLFTKLGWRGWRFYVPTGALAGLVIASVPMEIESAWYVLCSAAGLLCATVFSLVLTYVDRLASGSS